MEKNLVNPWKWQDNFGYTQAVEVKQNEKTLYCAGQCAMDGNGAPVEGSMQEQIKLSLQNLEQVIVQGGYSPANIARLNIYTISIPDTFAAYGELAGWLQCHGCVPASTLLEVKALAFPQLKIEIEATVVG